MNLVRVRICVSVLRNVRALARLKSERAEKCPTPIRTPISFSVFIHTTLELSLSALKRL